MKKLERITFDLTIMGLDGDEQRRRNSQPAELLCLAAQGTLAMRDRGSQKKNGPRLWPAFLVGSPTWARTRDLRITRTPCFRKDVDYAFAMGQGPFRRAPSSLYTFRSIRSGLARRCLEPCGR